MDEDMGPDESDIQALADQMFGEGNAPPAGHPAWQEIFNQIPQEYHAAVAPVLQKWDTGVSRQFQKIHDSYAPLKQFEDLDPEQVREAMGVYNSLNENPSATWEAIGRVYGLSPQQVSQVVASQEDAVEDDDMYDDLPKDLKEKLARLDMHEQVLETITDELLQRQQADREAQEDADLEEYLDELREEFGDFDENYVVGLIASGIDGDDAVRSFFDLVNQLQGNEPESDDEDDDDYYPSVLSGGGGIPTSGEVDPRYLSNQDTQDLVAEILRMTNEQ